MINELYFLIIYNIINLLWIKLYLHTNKDNKSFINYYSPYRNVIKKYKLDSYNKY